jgi:hypothetical protein
MACSFDPITIGKIDMGDAPEGAQAPDGRVKTTAMGLQKLPIGVVVAGLEPRKQRRLIRTRNVIPAPSSRRVEGEAPCRSSIHTHGSTMTSVRTSSG